MRERTMGGFAGTSARSYWTGTNPNTVEADATILIPNVTGTYQTMSDVVTPGFKRLQREGSIINSPMIKTVETHLCGDAGFRFQKTSGDRTFYGDISNTWMTLAYGVPAVKQYPSIDDLIHEAQTAALAGVLKPTVQGLVSLAELGKTLRMIASPMKGLRDHILTTGRGKKGRRTSLSESARNSWLESRYGWRPLMGEISGALKALSKTVNQRMTSRAIRALNDEEVFAKVDTYLGGYTNHSTVTNARSVVVRAGILYEHELTLADYQWGNNISDLPATAWELVPFSFVVDWFANVSDFIDALTPKAGSRTLASWTTVITTRTASREAGAMTLAGWTNIRSPGGVDFCTLQTVQRSPSVGYPRLVVKVNGLKSVLDDFRALDAIALFTQQLAR